MEQFHKNLDVWKVSTELVLDIYAIIEKFPKIEQYSLSDQMRRADISIPSNIAEGCARNTQKEKIHFLYISRGSCAELDTQIYLAKNWSISMKKNIYKSAQNYQESVKYSVVL